MIDYDMADWFAAVADAEGRDECCDGDGGLTCRFWTDAGRVWATPYTISEAHHATEIEYEYERGAGYLPR